MKVCVKMYSTPLLEYCATQGLRGCGCLMLLVASSSNGSPLLSEMADLGSSMLGGVPGFAPALLQTVVDGTWLHVSLDKS